MPARWNVDQNTGDRALLSSGFVRKEVLRPKALSVVEFCDLLRPGTIVLDRVIQTLDKW